MKLLGFVATFSLRKVDPLPDRTAEIAELYERMRSMSATILLVDEARNGLVEALNATRDRNHALEMVIVELKKKARG